jgi:hypothetical protein
MTALCIRCGASRADYRETCVRCGFTPEGEGLLVAWLLSSENLGEAEIEATGKRIAAGEPVRPSARMLEHARRSLGLDFASDPGLDTGQRLALFATSFLLTPLVGLTCWWWWRRDRPRASVQALALSLPASIVLFLVGFWFGRFL